MTKPLGRFEGRLFAEGGCLFLVVHADEATGEARVTCRIDGQTQVIEMPVAEVARRVAACTGLILDNLNAPATAERLLQEAEGWYFSAREGLMGPYHSKREAGHQLVRHILAMQTIDEIPKEPSEAAAGWREPGPGRRRTELRQTA